MEHNLIAARGGHGQAELAVRIIWIQPRNVALPQWHAINADVIDYSLKVLSETIGGEPPQGRRMIRGKNFREHRLHCFVGIHQHRDGIIRARSATGPVAETKIVGGRCGYLNR